MWSIESLDFSLYVITCLPHYREPSSDDSIGFNTKQFYFFQEKTWYRCSRCPPGHLSDSESRFLSSCLTATSNVNPQSCHGWEDSMNVLFKEPWSRVTCILLLTILQPKLVPRLGETWITEQMLPSLQSTLQRVPQIFSGQPAISVTFPASGPNTHPLTWNPY